MDNQNTYVVFINFIDHINNLQAAKDIAFEDAVVNFNLDLNNEDDVDYGHKYADDYVIVTFNSPIDSETMEKLCRSISWEYHVDGYELHQEISDFYNTDVTIVYPSERVAA